MVQIAHVAKYYTKFFLSLANKEVDLDSDTIKAITLNVSQMDGVIPAPQAAEPAPAPKAEAKPAPKAEKVEAEEVPEPIKVTKKAAPVVEEKSELSDIVGDWDD